MPEEGRRAENLRRTGKYHLILKLSWPESQKLSQFSDIISAPRYCSDALYGSDDQLVASSRGGASGQSGGTVTPLNGQGWERCEEARTHSSGGELQAPKSAPKSAPARPHASAS